jgi:hypothetical protein
VKEDWPVPPLETESCPVQPRVRFCAEMEPVTLVSLVTLWTTFEFRRAAASVPVHCGVKVKVPPELVTLRRRLVSEEVAMVRAPVCVLPYVCFTERTPVFVTFPPEYERPEENVVVAA